MINTEYWKIIISYDLYFKYEEFVSRSLFYNTINILCVITVLNSFRFFWSGKVKGHVCLVILIDITQLIVTIVFVCWRIRLLTFWGEELTWLHFKRVDDAATTTFQGHNFNTSLRFLQVNNFVCNGTNLFSGSDILCINMLILS